jgi:hypothetical protein
MRALTLDDLLPLDEFAGQRRRLFEAHVRYLDRYRRVRVGPQLMLIFENRQTLWFRVQELLRVARLNDANQVQQELDVYNRLLPGPGQLQAALLIHIADESRLTEELSPWRTLRGEDLRLCLDGTAVPAHLVTCRSEDLAIGTAHWVHFTLDDQERQRLRDWHCPVYIEAALPTYRYDSAPLSEEVRQSLLEDLELSDRDAA